jgi:hypothetical protein
MFRPESVQLLKRMACRGGNSMQCPDAGKAFVAMRTEMIAVIIKERTNVEPGRPVQHSFFKPVYTGYGERNKIVVQDAYPSNLKIIFLIIEPAVVEEVHVFEFVINS